MRSLLVILIVLALASSTGRAHAAARVALVIGNGGYEHAPTLANPTRDASAIAATLRDVGFEVIEALDLDSVHMRARLVEFGEELESAEAGLFFYAGHGLQIADRNYLIPVDASLTREADLYINLIRLDDVLRIMEATTPLRIVLLDSCRDNPLARVLARAMGATRSLQIGDGLAEVDAAVGTLVAYSTAPGSVASDGEGPHSPFTAALLEHLPVPGLELRQILSRVRANVLATTAGRQVPWDSSSLTGDFYFRNAGTPVAAADTPAAPGGGAIELAFWQSMMNNPTIADLEDYLGRYPRGEFASLARRRLQALRAMALREAIGGLARANSMEPAAGVSEEGLEGGVGLPGDARSQREPGDVFRDCQDCPEMVVVSSGSFEMGSTQVERAWAAAQSGRPDWYRNEGPRHRVTIAAPFAVSRTEVTVGQYRSFVEAVGDRGADGCHAWLNGGWTRSLVRTWRTPGFAQTDQHPVTCISWNDAVDYVGWLNEQAPDTDYRLLSEAEWEYAARAGATTYRYWGDDTANTEACAFANVADRAARAVFENWNVLDCDDGAVYSAPVAQHVPNDFGLFDMLGNAWEWVADCYHPGYDGGPTDGTAWDADPCAWRIRRGGSWGADAGSLRAAFRSRLPAINAYLGTSFRVARSLPAAAAAAGPVASAPGVVPDR